MGVEGLTLSRVSGTVPRIMLMIRLQRVGRKNYAEFRVVVTEKTRAAKSSNYVELVGHYNPHDDSVTVNSERVLYWIQQGAQVSDTVHNLLVSQKVIEGKKKNVLPKKTPIKKAEEAVAPTATKEVEETPASEPAVAVEEK
ncbi:MAG: 30S ribosomal protein S16 [Parcubacteria group bacterium GW2011_GWD2_42_14]|nr:MAG: 30S ribosomal protein S16 [Parcubacteria group bacterium GW2011_GWD2_42_14]